MREPRASQAELKTHREGLPTTGEFLQAVIDATPEITLVIDRDYQVVLANRAAKEMAGGKDPAASCLKCHQVSHRREIPCDGFHEPCPLKEVIETKRPTVVEHIHYDASGNEVHVEITAAPIFDESGEVIQVVEACRDITKRKQAEEKLRSEKDISEATLKSLPGVFYMFDDRGNFLRWNTNFEEISGYAPDEILRMHPLDFIASQDKKPVADKIQEVFATGQAIVEASFLTRDGRELPFLFTGVRCEIDGKKCLLGTGTDIAERVAAERALEARVCQQKVVAELGRYALTSGDLSDVIDEVVKRLAETLGVGYCKVLELLPDGQALLLRAGVGWHEGLVGRATVPVGQESQAGYTLLLNEPVIVEDLATETRFSGPPLLHDHNVVSGMSVMIPGPKGPWGVLGIHTTKHRSFGKDDATFLQSVANVLADAITRQHVEEELRASERNYHEVFNSVNDVIVVHDGQTGAILDVNDTFCRVFGVTLEEARQLRIGDLSLGEPPYSQEEVVGWVRRAVEEGPQLFEWVFKRKNGELLWVEVNLKLAAIGKEDRVLAVIRDISERKQAEESLQRSEQRFRSLVETTSDWIWETDENGVYTYASPKVKDLLGYEPEEILGKTPFDLMPPGEADRVNGLFRDNCESHQSFAQLENTNLHKDGRRIVLETSGVPIVDRDGSLRGYRGVDRDISDRKRAAEALRKSEQKYRVLFERSADATLIIEGDKFVDCNDAVVEMLRYSNKADLLSTHPSELSPEMQPDGRPSYEKANEMMAIAYRKGSHRFEWDHKRADGEVFPVEVLLTAIPVGESKILHVVWRDITERKQAEHEREELISNLESQNAELERFAYTVSHDLKSPLITIACYLGLLREDVARGDKEALEGDFERMETAADKMTQLLGEVLELSRIGRVVTDMEYVSLHELAEKAVKLVQGQVTQRGVRIDIAPDLPVVFGDRQRLLEVMQNLIDNAIKYMGDQPDPTIEIGCRNAGGVEVYFVKDNGIGIDSVYHERVFGLFDQLDQSIDGSGVGLALVKRIIELHGGRIWVESDRVEGGSAFCFTILVKE